MKPEDGYIACIINPKSGASSHKAIGRKLIEYFLGKGFKVRPYLTTSLKHACELASEAGLDNDCAMVVVDGGDGTVREAAHGLVGSNKPLLIIPGGTENLLASELGFDEKLETMIKTFEESNFKTMDLGRINGRYFTSIAGFGFDGIVVDFVNGQRKGHIDHFDYFWPIWKTFWNYKFEPMKVEVDGEEIFNGRGLVFVGNISRYALGLHILRNADYGDGLLDVCIYRCSTRIHLLKHSLLTVLKKHSYRRDVVYRQGKKIRVTSQYPNIKTEIDGDPGDALPAEIEVIPHAVNLMVLKGAKPAGIRTRLIRALG